VKIRRAVEADLAGIHAIYDEQVLNGTATFDTVPRTAPERFEWFKNDGGGRYPLLVAEEHGRILGWARLYAWSPRPAYLRTAENAVYVHADARRRGVARQLMAELIRLAKERAMHVLIARVVEGNPASRQLHEALGFQTIGVMKEVGEKFGQLLDVRLMDLHL